MEWEQLEAMDLVRWGMQELMLWGMQELVRWETEGWALPTGYNVYVCVCKYVCLHVWREIRLSQVDWPLGSTALVPCMPITIQVHPVVILKSLNQCGHSAPCPAHSS